MKLWSGVVFGLCLTNSAVAFQLDDHERVTRQAHAEFAKCFPVAAARVSLPTLVEGDRDEDLNLVEKELFYSHYFSPHKKLKMWRGDSLDRLKDLEPALLQCRANHGPFTEGEVMDLGHAIHHLQDMAVPAHVVPVTHSFWDGFETYTLGGDIASGWSCAQLQANASVDFQSLLQQTALSTFVAIQDMRVELTSARKPAQTVGGMDFWQESEGDDFGNYGRLDNHFGDPTLSLEGETYQVADTAYREFKRGQLRLAVQATLRGLQWAASL